MSECSGSDSHSCFQDPAGYIRSHRWIFDGISPATIDYIERYQHGSVDRLPGENDCFYSSCGVTPVSARTSSTQRTSCTGSYDDACERFTGSSTCSSDCTDYKAAYSTSGGSRKIVLGSGSSSTPRSPYGCSSSGSLAGVAAGAAPVSPVSPMLASRNLRKLKTGKPPLAAPSSCVQAYGGGAADDCAACSPSSSVATSSESPVCTKPAKGRLSRFFCLGI